MFEKDLDKVFKPKKEEDFNYNSFIVPNENIDKDLGEFLSGNFKKGLGIGISGFDRYLMLKENQLWASTGKKGGGKTTITQIHYLMWSICHGIRCVVAYQENDDWHVKFNIMSMLLGMDIKDVKRLYLNEDLLYNKALEWINKHYIFIDVKTIKEATQVTKALIDKGEKIHTLIIDPANSFLSGFSSTGNERTDQTITAIEVLKFAKNVCSVHVSQHPIISKQRDSGKVTSYDAENGVYLNKAHGTYTINREKGTSTNEIAIDNERTTHMGGGQTHPDSPMVMEWRPNGIDLIIDGEKYHDVIQELRQKHNPLNEDTLCKSDEGNNKFKEEAKPLPTVSVNDAFGTDEDIPF